MDSGILILENQIVIMQGMLCDPNISNDILIKISEQISLTRARLIGLK